MEGVIDPLMRDILCSINDYDLCVTEFIRVVDSLVPKHVYYRICPELRDDASTGKHTPLRIQLLGQEPHWMAENAVRAIELGSHGIDVNFGCPAKAVNKSKGGAVLLKDPEKIYQILSTIKTSINDTSVLSAKIRLGFDDTSLFNEIISAINTSGASELAIHARTKLDGYNPPAYWEYISKAVSKSTIKIIANGEIWNRETALECVKKANTSHLMLGRGALSLPNIANTIKYNAAPMSWLELQKLLLLYSTLELNGDKSYYFSSRLKQWLKYLKLQYPHAEQLFQNVKKLNNKDQIISMIKSIN
ncbi:tRNA-dihydrouridine synthase [Colwellia sp. UCD-KL20]|uniref:tRNA-dihydrouridine synthase n=1 Tax=Colwellia sp. UCD-KL20 TaxID=1917165 RepID=UPI0009712C7B|nr:tRNA-dihydrouridine synthase [Colwellia sp. UCD-KL20]